MTETEQAHLDNIRKLWVETGKPANWDLDTGDYRAILLDGKLLWFKFPIKHGWQRVKVEEML